MRRLATALLLAGACIHREPVPTPDEGAWARVRDEHTRHVELYDGLTMRAFATATWEAPEVRAARVERTAAWKAMTAQERAALQATEDADAAKFDDFTVSMVTADRADNDLDANRTSWRVALVAEGAPDVIAAKVRMLANEPLVRTLYPQVGDFDTVYRVRFARRPDAAPLGATPFTLRIAGPRGRMDFPFGPGTEPGAGVVPPGPAPAATAH